MLVVVGLCFADGLGLFTWLVWVCQMFWFRGTCYIWVCWCLWLWLVVCWWFGVGCFAVGFVLACLVWFWVYACDYWLRFDFGVDDVVVLVVFITIVAGLLLLVIWLVAICGLFVGWCLLHAMDVSGGGLFV